MAGKFELNNTTPAAPAGHTNVQWQVDASGNVSAHVGATGGPGGTQTPWTDHVNAAGFRLDNAAQIESKSGGFKFPDGSVQTTATLQGPVGPEGDPGPQGEPGEQGIPGPQIPFLQGHTWAVAGDISALTALPALFVPVRAGQTTKLTGLRCRIASGTSVEAQLQRNGANVGAAVTVNTTPATTVITPVTLADNDELSVILSSPVGTPSNLSITAYLEHTP